jgi:cytochrome c oxidase subunit 2
MFTAASDIAKRVDNIFLFILVISVFFLVLITFLMVYFAIKYNRKKNIPPENIEGNNLLEIIWTVVPTVLVLVMFYYGFIGFKALRNVPKDAMVVNVTGRMWSWLFEYDGGISSDVLRLPVDKPVKLALSSQDVIHSFFIPAFRLKEDAVPGLNTYISVTPNKVGTYDALCAEYCGLRHSYMLAKVEVMPQEGFEAWYEGQLAASRAEKEEWRKEGVEGVHEETKEQIVARAENLLKTKGCVACHTTDGSPLVGPTFKGILGRKATVVTAGKEREVTVDKEYLRRSVLEPNADLVKGFPPIMPPQKGIISEHELEKIVEYLEILQ